MIGEASTPFRTLSLGFEPWLWLELVGRHRASFQSLDAPLHKGIWAVVTTNFMALGSI